MTWEEAIEELERLLRHWDDLENDKRCFWGYDNEAVALALSALRPVSREQVEKAEWIWSTGNVYICSSCGEKTHVDECMGTPIYDFCPFCMAPMTDEAVQMVMERMEKLYETI